MGRVCLLAMQEGGVRLPYAALELSKGKGDVCLTTPLALTLWYLLGITAPLVQLKWGTERCQMTPDEARAHAYAILDAANAAETDAIMVAFLKERVGLKEGVDIGAILNDFRQFRERKYTAKDGSHRTKL
jgi:hypothetical protein